MINICTHCDSGYFLKGLALYKSLTETCSEFTLHWLCNDREVFAQLTKINLPNVVLYALEDLEKDPELFKAKSNPASKWGNQYSQYCWTLTPYFINYLLGKIEGKLIYADADIYFYRSPQIILDIVGKKAVGIHSHRFSGIYRNTETGWYNVGVIIFDSEKGKHISNEWKRWLINTNNEYYNTHGMCGDQKYLDLFPELWKEDVCIFDDERCSHLAPWNCDNIQYGNAKHIFYRGKISPVAFAHYSHFNIDTEKRTYRDSNSGEWSPCRNPEMKRYYDEYSGSILSMYDRYLR